MYGDPDAMDRLAATLRGRADEIREHADDHCRQAAAARWSSTAAAAFRARVANDRAAAYHSADGIDRAADVLAAHAEQVRATLALIARFERDVMQWCRSRADQVQDAARELVGALPGPGELHWLEVGRRWQAAEAGR